MSRQLWDRHAATTFGLRGGEGIKVSELRTVFNIEKNKKPTTNPAKIKIYNLNRDSRNYLDELVWYEQEEQRKLKDTEKYKNYERGEWPTVILETGYDVMEHLFTGSIATAETIKKGPDFITTIEAGDGEVAITKAKIDKGYAAGSSYETIIKDILNSMKEQGKVAIGTLKNIKTEITQNGMTISGISSKILSGILKKQDLEWSIQDGEIQILGPLEYTGEDAVLLTPETGLIGIPSMEGGNIKFKSLINGNLIPGRLALLECETIVDTTVKIDKAVFAGDTHGQPWYVSCEGIVI